MLRLATPKEIEFYEKVLYPIQDEIFELIQSDMFYLSGGTCISRFYYDHRYSDDLDFFFDGHKYPEEKFTVAWEYIIERIRQKFDGEVSINRQYFKRMIVRKGEVPLKIEFIFENFRYVGERKKVNEIFVDSKENIATNKLTAVYDRKTFKDWVDLYFLLKEIDFEQVAEWATYKMIPLDYEGLLITFSDTELQGEVLLKKRIPQDEFNNFVKNLLKRMFDYARDH